jgi:hypothetical protein
VLRGRACRSARSGRRGAEGGRRLALLYGMDAGRGKAWGCIDLLGGEQRPEWPGAAAAGGVGGTLGGCSFYREGKKETRWVCIVRVRWRQG